MPTTTRKVEIRPVVNKSPSGIDNYYSDWIDISEFCSSVSEIKKKIYKEEALIDSFAFGSCNVTIQDFDNLFGDIRTGNSGGFFAFGRDRALVRISVNDNILFIGILEEQRTRDNYLSRTVVLSFRSVESSLSVLNIIGGVIPESALISTVLGNSISTILASLGGSFIAFENSPNNSNDFNLLNTEELQSKNYKEVFDILLFLTNQTLITANRSVRFYLNSENTGVTHNLNDINSISIKNISNGIQRVINQVVINYTAGATDDRELEARVFNQDSINKYGLKSLELSNYTKLISGTTQAELIANRMIEQFKEPKVEIDIEIDIDFIPNISLFDLVDLNLKQSIIGKSRDEVGFSLSLGDKIAVDAGIVPYRTINKTYKVIEIGYNLSILKTILKLREI